MTKNQPLLQPNHIWQPANKEGILVIYLSEQSLRKMINIDQFGRYRGGLPRKGTTLRGNSLGQTGTLYRQE